MDENFHFFPCQFFALVYLCDGLAPEHFLMSPSKRALTLGVLVFGEVAEAEKLEVEGDVKIFKIVFLKFDVFRRERKF